MSQVGSPYELMNETKSVVELDKGYDEDMLSI